MHAIIPKGIVGGFEFTVFQRNFKEWHERPCTVCLRVQKKSNKSRYGSYNVKKKCIFLSPILPFGIVACTLVRQPFSKQLYIKKESDGLQNHSALLTIHKPDRMVNFRPRLFKRWITLSTLRTTGARKVEISVTVWYYSSTRFRNAPCTVVR